MFLDPECDSDKCERNKDTYYVHRIIYYVHCNDISYKGCDHICQVSHRNDCRILSAHLLVLGWKLSACTGFYLSNGIAIN